MPKPKAQTTERKIRRLGRELEEIDKFFYRSDEIGDRSQFAGMLERKRDDIVRSTVLQMHTAIEDLLNLYIINVMLGTTTQRRPTKLRTNSGKAIRRMLYGAGSLGFDMKLTMALTLGIISAQRREQLMELNTIRNKCSHNWLLKMPVRRGRRPRQKKPALLSFRGSDLHRVETLKEFYGEYGRIYYRLFLEYLD